MLTLSVINKIFQFLEAAIYFFHVLGKQLFIICYRIRQLIMVQVNHAFGIIVGGNTYTIACYNTSGYTNNDGIWRNLFKNYAAAANFGIVAYLEGTEHLRTAGNNNIVADGGMALALFLAGTAKGNSLIERDVAAKLSGFADNKSHTMVNEKTGAQFSTGMDVYTGKKRENVLSRRGNTTQPFR